MSFSFSSTTKQKSNLNNCTPLQIKAIFQKDYQTRSSQHHEKAVHFLRSYFQTLSAKSIKLLTFYVRLIDGNTNAENSEPNPGQQTAIIEQTLRDHQTESGFLIQIKSSARTNGGKQGTQAQKCNPQNPSSVSEGSFHQMRILKKEHLKFPNGYSFGLFISNVHYLCCLALGETSIEEEIDFLNCSEYLCSVPKRKYFNILRHATVAECSFRQNLYSEGQQIESGQSGSGVFLVRSGELAYLKKVSGKSVEVFRFSEGHLIGTIEYESSQSERFFTVKGKNSRCVLYRFTEEFFSSFIRPFCSQLLEQKQRKLNKFLKEKSKQISDFRTTRPEFASTLRTAKSTDLHLRQTGFKESLTQRDFPTLIKTSRESADIEEKELQKQTYVGLRYKGALQGYPMTAQRANFPESDFNDMNKLADKRQKIDKIRSLTNTGSGMSKQEILFSMFQTSYRFNKERRKQQNILRRSLK